MAKARIPELSIVSPFFNEEGVIGGFAQELRDVLEQLGVPYEVVFVDDGSTDGSVNVIRDLQWAELKTISLVFNSGHQAALDAGYRAATGEFVISMDSDLQHPPVLITQLYETAKTQKVDVVYAVRSDRKKEKLFKRLSAGLYYLIMGKLTEIEVRKSAADFRLVSRRVVTILNSLTPGRQVFRLLIPSLGFPSASVPYVASERPVGRSKYTFRKMVGLSVQSVLQFSTQPLHFAVRVGVAFSLLALLGFIYVLFTFLSGDALPGWASLISTLLILFGLQFVVLGVIGVYIGQLVNLVQNRPAYVLRDEEADK
jgi:dolichol-phosphate mannosyltransferase